MGQKTQLFCLWMLVAGCICLSHFVASAESFRVSTYNDFMAALADAGAGDSVILDGGTYNVPCDNTQDNTITFSSSGTSSNHIYYGTVNNERAVFDFQWPDNSKVVTGESVSSYGFAVRGDHLYFKNITITKAGYQGAYVYGNHITFEHCVFHDNWNSGLEINKGASYVTALNCDAYRNFDSNYKQGGMADGFASKQQQGPGNRFIGCRAWENSDDGYDTYDSPQVVTFENCWAFRNGINVWNFSGFDGNGNGFKVGGNHVVERNILKNCVAFDNVVKGFDQNNNRGGVTVLNCTAYRNGINFGFGGDLESGERHTFKNNVSIDGSNTVDVENADQSKNSWNGGVSVSESDFVSLDVSFATAARNPDGSLPHTDLFRLKPSSDLVDAGVDVGIPFSGDAPDLGAFELITNQVLTYAVSATAGNGGSVSQAPSGSRLEEGTSVTFTAVADEGYVFDGWSGDYSGSQASYTIGAVQSDVTLVASFRQDGPVMHDVSVTADNGGSVSQVPSGSSLEEGASVTFTAVADEGYYFAGWSGEHTGADATYAIQSLDSDVTLSAEFVSTTQTVYEAESAVMINTVDESVNEGFSGTGYANFDNAPGSSIEFRVYAAEAGEKCITITFANGTSGERVLSASVNGREPGSSLVFAGDEDWASWNQLDFTADFNQGINAILLTSVSDDGGPNVDKIEISTPSAASGKLFEKAKPVVRINSRMSTLKVTSSGFVSKVNIFTLNGRCIQSITIDRVPGNKAIQLPENIPHSGHFLVETVVDGQSHILKTGFLK